MDFSQVYRDSIFSTIGIKSKELDPNFILPDVISYCKKFNIPFTQSEQVHYQLNQARKNHRMYSTSMKYCFKSKFKDPF